MLDSTRAADSLHRGIIGFRVVSQTALTTPQPNGEGTPHMVFKTFVLNGQSRGQDLVLIGSGVPSSPASGRLRGSWGRIYQGRPTSPPS